MKFVALVHAFVKTLGDLEHGLSGIDHVWNVRFPDQGGQWHHFAVNTTT